MFAFMKSAHRIALLFALVCVACAGNDSKTPKPFTPSLKSTEMNSTTEVATLGGGCFWVDRLNFSLEWPLLGLGAGGALFTNPIGLRWL